MAQSDQLEVIVDKFNKSLVTVKVGKNVPPNSYVVLHIGKNRINEDMFIRITGSGEIDGAFTYGTDNKEIDITHPRQLKDVKNQIRLFTFNIYVAGKVLTSDMIANSLTAERK